MKKKLLTKAEKKACIQILDILFSRSGKWVTSKYLEKKVGSFYSLSMLYLYEQGLIETDILSVNRSMKILDAIISNDEVQIEKAKNSMRYRLSERGEAVIVGLKTHT